LLRFPLNDITISNSNADPLAPVTENSKVLVVNLSTSAARFSSYRAVMAAVAAVAFAIMVSIAATHLHIGLDADEGCAVCAAFVGKLEGPSTPSLAVPPVSVYYFAGPLRIAPQVESPVLVVLPPSCGPPRFA
jgi:hypothetical protein